MKFTAKTKDVANALKQAAYCLGSKAIVPILNNALFEASGDGFVTVTCTDLYQRITASFPAEVEAPAKTTLPAKKLLSILNNLTSADITFDTKDNHHTAIICGTTQIDICGLDVADFPDKTEVEPETSFAIETKEFAELIRHGGYAVSTDDGRKVLTGVLLDVDSNGIIAVISTDGKRLAIAEKITDIQFETRKQYIIPAAVVATLGKLKGDNIKLKLSEKYITAEVEDVTLSGKLVEGNYPNWRQIIPADTKNKAVINSSVLLAKLAIVSQMVGDDNKACFVFGANKIEFKTQSNDGSILDSMEIEFQPQDDKPIMLMFNPAFIAAAVTNCGDGDFTFCFNNEMSPCLFDFGINVKAIVMPIRNKQ